MAVNLIELKAEIANDPLSIGYSGLTDEQVAKRLNRVRDEDTGSNFEINRKEVTGGDIASAMFPSEFAALSAANRDYITMLTNAEKLSANKFRANLLSLFAVGSVTRTNLDQVFKTKVSRSVNLFGEEVNPSQVADARSLP